MNDQPDTRTVCSPLRWLAKKTARRSLAAAATFCMGFKSLAARNNGGRSPEAACVRVLTYHRCGRRARDPFCVSPEMFDAQMRLLAEKGLAVSLAELEAFLAGRASLPDGAVLVSVDDGCRSVLTQMLPVWRRHEVPAVVYVNPGLIEQQHGDGRASRKHQHTAQIDSVPGVAEAAFGHESGHAEPLMSWDDLGELVEAGIAVGSHGLTHRSLGRMSEREAREEAVRSRRLLEERLGVQVHSFAYPFGTRADFSPATARLLAEAGYTTAMTSQHGAVTAQSPPLELPRVKVEGGESLRMFAAICRGALDGWRVVDRHLWRLQLGER